MASFTTLPWELCHHAFGYLSLQDKLRFSATCKLYRTHFTPQLFETISFTNDNVIAQSALAAVKAHGAHTTRIEFVGRAEPSKEFATPVLLAATLDLLTGRHTPNVHTVQVDFDFNFDEDDDWDNNPNAPMNESIYVFAAIETDDYFQESEKKWNWRSLMNETWRALLGNHHVKTLIVKRFVPKWTTAFKTKEFQLFLGNLESATFEILGGDNGAGWRANTVWGYCEFLSNDFGHVFFRHMHKLKQLEFFASPEGPLGLQGHRYIPLAIQQDDMPLLQSLKLVNCFIGPELVSFIQGHAQVLRTLHLDECMGSDAAIDSMSWAQFFSQVYNSKVAIAELLVENAMVPLTSDERWGSAQHGPEEPVEIQEIRRKLKAQPELKLFGYKFLDEKYGICFDDEGLNASSFTAGNDQRAYDRLIGLVKQNAAQRSATRSRY
ncbi:hypothetical protein B0I35DRAFT_435420 [Stachybotrys elegans]|uniref:F-box domain-containing protein n=1 Tax=Stachybotrys elegans TaxID=80388 RepID=A0A8K0SNN6_9HYPO|nr:hypothetical protein B0I35DRAFT_435420 [Stachybotrys elegans]